MTGDTVVGFEYVKLNFVQRRDFTPAAATALDNDFGEKVLVLTQWREMDAPKRWFRLVLEGETVNMPQSLKSNLADNPDVCFLGAPAQKLNCNYLFRSERNI